ncbi:hypothetical protein DCC85_07250 [Paenibacillus sp. CAA11]|nr:hypothetical protein DCC85_07250 [Paenibacillus sp. CAA11]
MKNKIIMISLLIVFFTSGFFVGSINKSKKNNLNDLEQFNPYTTKYSLLFDYSERMRLISPDRIGIFASDQPDK